MSTTATAMRPPQLENDGFIDTTETRIEHEYYTPNTSPEMRSCAPSDASCGRPVGMSIEAGPGVGPSQKASGRNRTDAAGGFRRQEWNHYNNNGATAGARTKGRGNHHHDSSANSWIARSRLFSANSLHCAASASCNCKHSGRNGAGNPHRPAH